MMVRHFRLNGYNSLESTMEQVYIILLPLFFAWIYLDESKDTLYLTGTVL